MWHAVVTVLAVIGGMVVLCGLVLVAMWIFAPGAAEPMEDK